MQIAPTETFTLVASFQMVGHALRGVLIAERFSQGISRTGVILTETYGRRTDNWKSDMLSNIFTDNWSLSRSLVITPSMMIVTIMTIVIH